MKLIENKNIFKNSTFFALLPKEQKIVPVKFNSGVKYEELMNLENQKRILLNNINSFAKMIFLNILYFGEQKGVVNLH